MWQATGKTPIFQLLNRLVRIHKKALQLKVLQQTHRGILHMKSISSRKKKA